MCIAANRSLNDANSGSGRGKVSNIRYAILRKPYDIMCGVISHTEGVAGTNGNGCFHNHCLCGCIESADLICRNLCEPENVMFVEYEVIGRRISCSYCVLRPFSSGCDFADSIVGWISEPGISTSIPNDKGGVHDRRWSKAMNPGWNATRKTKFVDSSGCRAATDTRGW